MKIQKYLDEFHDGSLIDIEHTSGEIVLSIESAEMDLCDMKDDISLSERGTIKGKMHLESIKSIQINGISFNSFWKMPYDYGTVFDLQIQNNSIELQVSWKNAPKKPSVNDFSVIVIEAEKIWWENIPDLYDPFW